VNSDYLDRLRFELSVAATQSEGCEAVRKLMESSEARNISTEARERLARLALRYIGRLAKG
jgi:hypothetical protein